MTTPQPAQTAPPTITGVSPASGAGGTTVTITGTGLTGATSVSFGSTSRSTPTAVTDTRLSAVAPPGLTGTVAITVTTPAGASAPSSVAQFTFATSAPPSVTGVSPASGAAGTTVTITGTGLTGATSVSFGSSGRATPTAVTDTRLNAVAPPGLTGTVPVTVTTPAGTSAPSSTVQFTFTTGAGSTGGTGTTGPGTTSPGTTGPVTTVTGPVVTTPAEPAQGYYVDPGLSAQLVSSLVNIMQSASSPDALEAQNIILRRIALQGDVVGSRIPPPRNISEIGGYINLLTSLRQPEMRSQALAGILGVAGPTEPLGWVSNDQLLAFVTLPNDRPAGPGQPALSLTFTVRSDFSSALQIALGALHQQGCTLPIAGLPAITLPPATPGAPPPADALPYLGRTLDLATAAALVNPQADPLALVRARGTGDLFQIAAKVLAAGTTAVAPADYDALQCTASSCSVVAISQGQYVLVAPLLAMAGFYPSAPLPQPTSLTSAGWARLTNITGLVPGVTKLGDELSLLYNWGLINHSTFASALHWTWNGKTFT
jgi:hypothetical protein